MAPEPDPNAQGPKLNWKRVLVVALVTFGIAAVVADCLRAGYGTGRCPVAKGPRFQQVSEGTSDKGSETKKKEPTKKPTPEATEVGERAADC